MVTGCSAKGFNSKMFNLSFLVVTCQIGNLELWPLFSCAIVSKQRVVDGSRTLEFGNNLWLGTFAQCNAMWAVNLQPDTNREVSSWARRRRKARTNAFPHMPALIGICAVLVSIHTEIIIYLLIHICYMFGVGVLQCGVLCESSLAIAAHRLLIQTTTTTNLDKPNNLSNINVFCIISSPIAYYSSVC